ncbi:MATH and LRR domain-containing protein PFE0570w isoform X2 [Lucilia sericata]|uniref:MATH and LRR domain-containing protein PFE0570w isoform X2 n=1 Tax=Lucilia sericata TaxID=13632 RepID=UPI0018A85349|nr:MATH and LRR domain-containing protein PFE0570w isoform X2 [Lucilia sericata]
MAVIFVNSIEAYVAGLYNKRITSQVKTFHLEDPLSIENLQSSSIFFTENENHGKRKRRQTIDDMLRNIPQTMENEKMDLESLSADYETDCAKPVRFPEEIKQTSQIANQINILKLEPQKLSRQVAVLNHEANLMENSEEEKENSIENKEESKISDSYKAKAGDKTNSNYKFKKLSAGKNEFRNRNTMNDKLNLYKSILNDDQLISAKQTACCSNSDLSSCQQCSQHIEGGALANRYVKNKNDLKLNKNQPLEMDSKTKSKDLTKNFENNKKFSESTFKNQKDEDEEDDADEEQEDFNQLKYPAAVLKNSKQAAQNLNISSYNDFSSPKKNSETSNLKDKSLTWNSYQPLNDDQLENTKNNLSHEANYKLSKTEQDVAEKKKDFSWKWGIFKRSHQFNPMNEIKLKTSSRLMKKGFGASLPSYSLGETRKELMIENMLRKKEKLLLMEKQGKYDVDNMGSLKEAFGEDIMEPYDQLDEDFVHKPLEVDLGSIAQKYRVYNRQKRISDAIKRFKRHTRRENVKKSNKKLLKVKEPKAKDDNPKDVQAYTKNGTDIKYAKGKSVENNTKSFIKALSSKNTFAKQTSEDRSLELLKQLNKFDFKLYNLQALSSLPNEKANIDKIPFSQPLQRRKRSLQLETSSKAFSTNETKKLFSNTTKKSKSTSTTFKLAKRYNTLKALHSTNNKHFTKHQAFDVNNHKKLLKHTTKITEDDIKENKLVQDLKYDLIKGQVKKLCQKALKKPLKAFAKNTLSKDLSNTEILRHSLNKIYKAFNTNNKTAKVFNKSKAQVQRNGFQDFENDKKFGESFNIYPTNFTKSFPTFLLRKVNKNKSFSQKLLNQKQLNFVKNIHNMSSIKDNSLGKCPANDLKAFRETNQSFTVEKAENANITKKSFYKGKTDLTVMGEKNLYVNNSNESFHNKDQENLNTYQKSLLKKSLKKSFKTKLSFKTAVTNDIKDLNREIQLNESTKSDKSFKRLKRSLKSNPEENGIKSETNKNYRNRKYTSYYDDLYKPQFNLDYANTKLLKSNAENEFLSSRELFKNEELQRNLNKDFDFTFNREKFDNLNDKSLPLQKFGDINYNNLWQKDEPHKSEKRLIKKSTNRRNNAKHRHQKAHFKRQNLAFNNNNITDITAKLKLDDFPRKVQLLKDKYLNDLQNFNKNYKFNENHFTWPQTNFKNYIDPKDNSTDILTTTDDSKNLTLELRNEILNCKAFASLEDFLKSLPQNITNSLLNPKTETSLYTSTEKIVMDIDTQVITETTTISPPTVLDSTIICTTTEELETTTETTEDKTQPTEVDYEQITECSSDEDLNETSTEAVSESVTEEDLTPTTCTADNDVKLNISINANVHGNLQANHFCGNGSFNIIPGLKDDRLRRGTFSGPLESFQKRKCDEIPTQKPYDTEDNHDINDLMSGKYSNNVVKNIFKTVQESPDLKALWPSLKRNQPGETTTESNFFAIRNEQNENVLQNSEKLLAQVMSSINTIIESQARSHACVPLRPDLQEFYNMILQSRREQDMTNLIDPNEIEQETRLVKKLLKQYEEQQSRENQMQEKAVKEELLENLSILQQLQDNEKRQRRKSKANLSDNKLAKEHYSGEFLKLLKAAEFYKDISRD